MMRAPALACAFALAIKLALSLATYGTNDILFWEANLRKIQTDGGLALYRDGAVPEYHGRQYRVEPFNQPPFMVHALRVWGELADISGLPLRFWLRITSSLADTGMVWLVWLIARAEKIPISPWLVALLALSPVSILVSGFHGNTDPLMISFVLLAVWLAVTSRPAWAVGIAFGMAIDIKVVPVIFVPALLLYLRTMRNRTAFAVSAAGMFLLASAPYLLEDPALIVRSVFGYVPALGSWGFGEIAYLISPAALAGYRAVGRFVALGAVLVAAALVYRRGSQKRLFEHCGLAVLLFLFFSPGFGPQYLAWVLPWMIALAWKRATVFYVSASVFVIASYGIWSRGGWYLANMLEYSPMPPGAAALPLFEIACWISAGASAAGLLRSDAGGAVKIQIAAVNSVGPADADVAQQIA